MSSQQVNDVLNSTKGQKYLDILSNPDKIKKIITGICGIMFVLSISLNVKLATCEVSQKVANCGQTLQVLYNTIFAMLLMTIIGKTSLSSKHVKYMYIMILVLSFIGLVCCSIILSDSSIDDCEVKGVVGTFLALSIIMLLMTGGMIFVYIKYKTTIDTVMAGQ